MKKLRLVLGDQLNEQHSWWQKPENNTLYLMAEMRQEATYTTHHIQKITAFLMAMRQFAQKIKENHPIIYIDIAHASFEKDLKTIIEETIREHQIEKFEYQEPDEYRLQEQLSDIASALEIPSECFETEHFYTSKNELTTFFKGKKQLLMERYYRHLRQKHQILMQQDKPLGGQWNFDHENRKKFNGEVCIPEFPTFERTEKELQKIEQLLLEKGIKTIGTIDHTQFQWPLNRSESWTLLEHFTENLLPYFGTYQDALYAQHHFLFHSRLSFALNTKMISPREVIDFVCEQYYKNASSISIANVEGFVRQIIGWREYVRGIYWKEMPHYKQLNYLGNQQDLPDYFWTGKTKMKCMEHALSQSLQQAYAHHIQRLMVIGNFSLLTHRHPDAVDNWYLGIYIDAIEWVELPNTRGMSQYADGGIIATKPYVSSGSYIHKMSNYCGSCHYKVKETITDKACPFNSLYWNFLDEKQTYFQNNQRMSLMLHLWQKKSAQEKADIIYKAQELLEHINDL